MPAQDQHPDGGADVMIGVPVATAVAATTTVELKLASNLWLTWGAIAIEEARAAREARVALARAYPATGDADLAPEMKAALKSIGAVSFALDALGKVLEERAPSKPTVAQALAYCPPGEDRNRGDHVTAIINDAFDDAAKISLTHQLHDLFYLRNGSVHHRVVMNPPTTHPLGLQTTAEAATYTTEQADRHAKMLVTIFAMAVNSSSKYPDVQEAFISYRPAVQVWLKNADDFR